MEKRIIAEMLQLDGHGAINMMAILFNICVQNKVYRMGKLYSVVSKMIEQTDPTTFTIVQSIKPIGFSTIGHLQTINQLQEYSRVAIKLSAWH